MFIFGFDDLQETWKSISISGDRDKSNAAPKFEGGKLWRETWGELQTNNAETTRPKEQKDEILTNM